MHMPYLQDLDRLGVATCSEVVDRVRPGDGIGDVRVRVRCEVQRVKGEVEGMRARVRVWQGEGEGDV